MSVLRLLPAAAGRGSPAGIDNYSMDRVFQERVRKFNEDNNEEVGEHWTPRDAVRLVVIRRSVGDMVHALTRQ